MSKSLLLAVFLFGAAFATQLSWKLEPATGPVVPAPRGGARLVNVDDCTLFYWGGFFECFDQNSGCDHYFYDDLYHYDIDRNKWILVNATSANGQFPEKRAFFGANYWEAGEVVVIFGGIRYNVDLSSFNPYGDIWFYSVEDKEWTIVQPVNAGPGIRVAPNVAIDGNNMYLFGGLLANFTVVNDVWRFNLVTRKWTQLIGDRVPGSPQPTYLASFRLDPSRDNIILHGGNIPPAASGAQSNTTWSYSIRDNKWTQLASLARGRIHNAAEVYDGKFFTAFGDLQNIAGENGCRTPEASAGQAPTDEVRSLNLRTNRWSLLNVNGGPGPLKRVTSTLVNDRMFVTGGYNYECPNGPTTPGFATWNTKLWSLRLD
jgi:hypothetical protein